MPTNDSNKGWMGANARVAKRWAPNATLEFINAKSQHYNGTAAFIADNLNTAAGQQFLQKQAQLSKLNKKQKAEVVLAAIERWMACVNAWEVPLNGNQLPEPLECEESVVESDEDE
ncbi:hypothetical protein B0H19DRAFT_1082901 [Mycena capillaripes]|nr:hypothetical protein B0H19DRAFT_1082901 [Mycena capillaripes]